jgi:uncharacterized membrane protein
MGIAAPHLLAVSGMASRPAFAPPIQSSPYSSVSVTAFLAALGGGILLGARPRNQRLRPITTVAGLALLGVAAHRPLSNALRKAGTKRRAGDLRFSMVVNRPVEEVFAFCADFENFPRFVHALREVRDAGDGRAHWCASTPSGGEIEWSTVTTKFVTNSVIGWRNVPGAAIATSGVLRFSPDGEHSTCVRVAIDYRVFKSGMADALAALVQPRRERELEADIRQLEQQIIALHGSEVVSPLPAPADLSGS